MNAPTWATADARSRLLSRTDVAELLAVSEATVGRYRRNDPTFPVPYRLASKTVRWRAGDIDDWLETKLAVQGPVESPRPAPTVRL